MTPPFPRWSTLSVTERFLLLLWRWSSRRAVEGFEVRLMFAGGAEARRMVEKVTSALSLIAALDPMRYAYLRRDLPRIFVGFTNYQAEYRESFAMCVLNSEFIEKAATSPHAVAATLLHEGAHARLARAGFTYDERHRGRTERICVETESHFLRKCGTEVPGISLLRAQAEWSRDRPDDYWTNAAFRERAREARRRVETGDDRLMRAGVRLGRSLGWLLSVCRWPWRP